MLKFTVYLELLYLLVDKKPSLHPLGSKWQTQSTNPRGEPHSEQALVQWESASSLTGSSPRACSVPVAPTGTPWAPNTTASTTPGSSSSSASLCLCPSYSQLLGALRAVSSFREGLG